MALMAFINKYYAKLFDNQLADNNNSNYVTNLIHSIGASTPLYSYRVMNVYPHDINAWTQGIVFEDGYLYESTGLPGRSSLRKIELVSGKICKIYQLPASYFGEGLTLWHEKLIQLTWKSRVGFVYNKRSFKKQIEFRYPTEGWGITHNGMFWIISDGTATLRFYDPETFVEVNRIKVHDQETPIGFLNELEYIQGEIYANVWKTDYIAKISPNSGKVVGWIDLSGLLSIEDRKGQASVLNGIAYDALGDKIYVTGKFWPKLFEIKVIASNR